MNFNVNTFAAATDPEALRIASLAQRRGLAARLLAAVLAGVLLCTWIGWTAAFAWFVAIVVWDAGVAQRLYDRLVIPNIDGDPRFSEWVAAGLCLVGGCIYASGWATAWLVGGSSAGFLAGVWFGITMIHALVYFSNVRAVFFACLLPSMVVATVLPFLLHMDLLAVGAILLVVAQAVALVVSAANDRNVLIATAAAQSAARQAAEEASTAKSQFLANMSHELRTPLNAVIGYAEILEEDLDADGKAQGAADANRIRKAARHLLGLINEVLDLSKIEAGRMELAMGRTDIAQIVADAVEQTRPTAEANGNVITVHMPETMAPVFADSGKLGQCMLNFLSNAAKFTNDGRIDVRVTFDGGELEFAVQDTGIGIGADDVKRLFQPFTQVDESFTRRAGGTGLGLVITQRLAELMGGGVSLVSTPGQGSTFTMRVPVDVAPAEPGHLDSAPTTRACVLVVEDEASARDLTRRALAALPFEVRTADTVAEGIAAFRALDPALVVLDVHLPDGAGWEVLAEVRRTRPDTPVVVVTIDDDRARALALGASEHILKPADREHIGATVLRLVAARMMIAA